ncbi:MAG: hypothetical protein QM704_11325 [Anaeromyxobacteraceae bacterium]
MSPLDRLGRAALPAATAALALLLVLPRADAPFSGPKRTALVVAAALSLALLPWTRRRPAALLALPVASVALSAFLGPHTAPAAAWTALGGAVLAFAWTASGVSRAAVVPAAAGAGAIAALVALAQWAGLDPFAAWAPAAGGARLGVYGTLGNPDFVASALAVPFALALGEVPGARRRWPWALAAAAMALALAATRSFATVVALGAGLAAALLHGALHGGRIPRRAAVALAVGAVLLALPLAGRSASAAAGGRIYLVRVAAPHALAAPAAGLGPGAVERLWPAWELELWKDRCGEDRACVEAHREGVFTGRQDHLHADWLELLVERGVPGVVSLLVLLGVGLAGAASRPGPRDAALGGALTAVAARASFDFPMARPADLVLLALAVALAVDPED